MAQDKSFIEVQFPVSKVSKESYKERKAGFSQTLTGLGKWWGRKPLILVRAAVLGLLMPVSNNPKKDMEIFLKILTMDDDGLKKRRNKSIPIKTILSILTAKEKQQYFEFGNNDFLPKFKKELSKEDKNIAIEKVWNRMSYDQKLTYCCRPEEIDNRCIDDWKEINLHLDTSAACLQELVEQLGKKRFGKHAVVGDCFCGGGSIPFETARIGCNVYASDLNPIAGLLTWADLNITTACDKKIEELRKFQKKVYDEVNSQIIEWGIETNINGDRAYSYIYCCETVCPECGYKLPLSPTWLIGKGTRTIAVLNDNGVDSFDIEIKSGVSDKELKTADQSGTVKNGSIFCPHCRRSTPISSLRKDRRGEDGEMKYGLRKWNKDEFLPSENDVFQSRLYCIRYTYTAIDQNGNKKMEKYYSAPTADDLEREQKVIELLKQRFAQWQEEGYIPSSEIEEGDKTTEPIRTMGWKYWHQLFNPRQLLTQGLFVQKVTEIAQTKEELIIGILGINKLCDYNSKLCVWLNTADTEHGKNTFLNQAFNTLMNYGTRSLIDLEGVWFFNIHNTSSDKVLNYVVKLNDARNIDYKADYWITDPPYADAVNYHELSEFFIAWDKKILKKAFPEWYADSKRILAVRGRDQTFNTSMVDIYSNIAKNMSDNGLQIIMFTHQDVSVWADLALIVWSAGLQVVAAWNIATETESGGLKDGNYVKGTVLLVLRKQTSTETAYLDEIYPDIEEEVKRQIESMHLLDDKEEPNFTDADYILAAYAAALKVLTSVKKIEDIDVSYELSRERKKGELSPIAKLIQSATKIAYDQLIPYEFDNFIWRSLSSDERFYIKGLEVEKNNVYQLSSYQELARGFGVTEYKDFMENSKANVARLKTPSEWANRNIGGDSGFASSLLRNIFMALYLMDKDDNVQAGKNWIRNEVEDYWNKRERICELLNYISTFEPIYNMKHWNSSAKAASILKELVANDMI